MPYVRIGSVSMLFPGQISGDIYFEDYLAAGGDPPNNGPFPAVGQYAQHFLHQQQQPPQLYYRLAIQCIAVGQGFVYLQHTTLKPPAAWGPGVFEDWVDEMDVALIVNSISVVDLAGAPVRTSIGYRSRMHVG